MRFKKIVRKLPVLALCVAVLAILGVVTHAEDPPLQPTGGGDDGRWDIGIEYVTDYPGSRYDLSRTDDTAWGLYNQLVSVGWAHEFAYGNGLAWEEDWKAESLGGTEDRYVGCHGVPPVVAR